MGDLFISVKVSKETTAGLHYTRKYPASYLAEAFGSQTRTIHASDCG
jgi:hypothetical protein